MYITRGSLRIGGVADASDKLALTRKVRRGVALWRAGEAERKGG